MILTLLAGLVVSAAKAQDKTNASDRANELFHTGEEEAALQIYREILEDDPTHYEALWNTALIYSNKGNREETKNDPRKYIDKSIEYAEKLLKHYPDEGHSHYAYAVALGRKTDEMRTRDRIRAAHEIHNHIEIAVDLIPDFAPVWHLYGVWHSDVANVSRGARLAARLLSSGLPDGSNEKAEEYLIKALEMDPDNILVHLDLARHYREVGRDVAARLILKNMLELEPRMKDDIAYQEEAREMLENLDYSCSSITTPDYSRDICISDSTYLN